MTRESYRKETKAKEQQTASKKRIRIRILPIWFRLLLVIVLIAGCAAGGAMVGYGVIGGGQPSDVFEKSTWTHIIDLVNKDE